jgi:DNA-binding MarR family transcriptional regulator
VDRTARNGLVRRDPDPWDTRAVRVTLTPKGARVVEVFYAETCRRVEKLLAGLDGAERDALVGLLGRIVLDNKVPLVFVESDGGEPAGSGGAPAE